MFTIEQIKAAHSKVKSGADFPAYIKELKQLGVRFYETFVFDGHTEFYGNEQEKISSDSKYENLEIAENSNVNQFVIDLKLHQKGQTDYPTFCVDCAKAGVEKWAVNIEKLTCTYYDKVGKELLIEKIPQ
ncbi:DUF1398 domain-containing protein [Flavobacterium amnicola]|uniref:DUF1398 domain-containing protein n=1 Tax=Flavobacterium amnicola TaxID=2506422 RepID=A0A4Q1K2Y4_9FLAO|nr:DUF1398 family protein [Flavobacterium amnicola]RXR16249.1 DUF1398 domain-containing protein [Flavobacterium amnicola]